MVNDSCEIPAKDKSKTRFRWRISDIFILADVSHLPFISTEHNFLFSDSMNEYSLEIRYKCLCLNLKIVCKVPQRVFVDVCCQRQKSSNWIRKLYFSLLLGRSERMCDLFVWEMENAWHWWQHFMHHRRMKWISYYIYECVECEFISHDVHQFCDANCRVVEVAFPPLGMWQSIANSHIYSDIRFECEDKNTNTNANININSVSALLAGCDKLSIYIFWNAGSHRFSTFGSFEKTACEAPAFPIKFHTRDEQHCVSIANLPTSANAKWHRMKWNKI